MTMLIFLENYKISPKTAMRIVGYIERPNAKDFIRPVGGGSRWHAKRANAKTLDIHYDLAIDGKHSVFEMPIAANGERYRILRKLDRFKVYEMEPERLSYLINRMKTKL